MHHHKPGGANTLIKCFALILVFALVEVVGGFLSGSLALLSDAGHMFSDATALGLAALAVWVGRQPASSRHSFGLVRAEVVAALFNSLFMMVIVAGIVYYAIHRLFDPQPVMGGTVMLVAGVGLIVNMIVAYVLHHGEQTLNTRAAMLHVMGDLLGSVAALLAGAIIYFTGWTPIDPILSLFVSALILFSSIRLLLDVLHVIMEGVPPYLDLPEVGNAMAAIDGVSSVHDLHIWTLSSGRVALSAHVVVSDMRAWALVLEAQREMLRDCFALDHITLQPESNVQIIEPHLQKSD